MQQISSDATQFRANFRPFAKWLEPLCIYVVNGFKRHGKILPVQVHLVIHRILGP